MGFENDYNAFINAIIKEDYKKAESVFASCDSKEFFIEKALEELEETSILEAVDSFVSLGLKKRVNDLIVKLRPIVSRNKTKKMKSSKVVLVHKKNKMRNKLYHLSGSSFENERISPDDILLALENSKAVSQKTA